VSPRLAVGAIVAFVVLTAVMIVTGYPLIWYRDTDFVSFWIAGRMLLEGRDPYDAEAFAAMHRSVGSAAYALVPGTGFGYPLPTALVVVPFSLLPLGIAAPVWLASQIVVATAGLGALAAGALRSDLRRGLPFVLGFAAASQPAYLVFRAGNMDGFLLGAVAGALALFLASRPRGAGALIGALVVKPHPFLLFVPALVLVFGRGARRAVTAAAAVAFVLVLASLGLRPVWPSEWARNPVALVSAPLPRANVWAVASIAGPWVAAICALLVIVAVLWWGRSRRSDPLTHAAAWLALSLFVAPYLWSHDHLLLQVCTVACIAMAYRHPRTRAFALVATAFGLVVAPWMLYAAGWDTGNEGLSAVTPVAALATLIGLSFLGSDVEFARAGTAGTHQAPPSPARRA